jgi:hypothetical protein
MKRLAACRGSPARRRASTTWDRRRHGQPVALERLGRPAVETFFGGPPVDASDVTIHFDGRSGLDAMDLNSSRFTTRLIPATRSIRQ